jgi:hypothetical protein
MERAFIGMVVSSLSNLKALPMVRNVLSCESWSKIPLTLR